MKIDGGTVTFEGPANSANVVTPDLETPSGSAIIHVIDAVSFESVRPHARARVCACTAAAVSCSCASADAPPGCKAVLTLDGGGVLQVLLPTP